MASLVAPTGSANATVSTAGLTPTVAGDELGRPHFLAGGLRGRRERRPGLGRRGDFGGLGASGCGRLLGDDVAAHALLHFVELRHPRLFLAGEGDEDRGVAGADAGADAAVLQVEGLGGDLRRRPELGQRIGALEERRVVDRQAVLAPGRFEIRRGLDAGGERRRQRRGVLLCLLELQLLADLILHLGEGALAGGALFEQLDHVEAELGLDQIGDLPGRQRERGVLERLDHRAVAEEAEVAAAALAGVVLGVLAGQRLEVGARRLRFLQRRVGLLAHRGRVLAGGLEQDVLRVHLLGVGELLQVGLVVALDLLRRRRDRGAQRLRVHRQVADLAAFAEAVARRILGEERLRLGVGAGEAGAELIGGEGDHLQLHFFVAAPVLGVGLLLGDGDPAGDRLLQLLREQVGADALLEVLFAQRRPLRLEERAIAGRAEELAVLAERRDVPDELDHLGVGDPQAAAHGFRFDRPAIDQLRQHLGIEAELSQRLRRQAAAALGLEHLQALVQLAPELAGGDRLAVDVGDRFVELDGAVAPRHEEGGHRDRHDPHDPLQPAAVAAHPIEHRHREDILGKEPVVKVPLHSPGDASRRSALLVARIFPIFSLLAPGSAGASPVSMRRGTSITGSCADYSRSAERPKRTGDLTG
jgi:hypothetical protein